MPGVNCQRPRRPTRIVDEAAKWCGTIMKEGTGDIRQEQREIPSEGPQCVRIHKAGEREAGGERGEGGSQNAGERERAALARGSPAVVGHEDGRVGQVADEVIQSLAVGKASVSTGQAREGMEEQK